MTKNERVYKFETSDGAFVYVCATDYDIAKSKLSSQVCNEVQAKFKYVLIDDRRVKEVKRALERGEIWASNMKLIIIY